MTPSAPDEASRAWPQSESETVEFAQTQKGKVAFEYFSDGNPSAREISDRSVH
jgi:hypothetical protein